MRLKFVFTSLTCAALVVVVAIWMRGGGESATHVPNSEPSSFAAPATLPKLRNQKRPESESQAEIEAASRQREALVMKSKSAIELAVVNNDPDALSLVVEKINDPEKEVRKAAIQGLVLLNNREAIPFLQAAMDRTSDTEDKAEMLKVIQSLETPSLTELQPTESGTKK